ncbi:MAG TPA: ATP-binding protein [Pyrinomonadaceae bacterium]|nr:ATP-binding protein [Pyrinomonadaceae bacterium]
MDTKIEQIVSAMKELREVGDDGPRARKLLDALFRSVHNLKARAAADGLTSLATAAHEFENVLHSLRTGSVDAAVREAIPDDVWNSLKQEQRHALQQSLAEGARLFLVHASFDVADFDREFQELKKRLSETGEVISTSARMDQGRINFRLLVARINADDDAEGILIAGPVESTQQRSGIEALERCFEKLSAEFVNLPSGNVWQQAVRAGKAAALASGKEVEFELHGEDLELDESIGDALLHLVRNAVDHGIESRGKVVIEAQKLDSETRITVTDDGRGIDPSMIDRIFDPGFSTASELSEISGRGVGLDAVKTAVEAAGGSITVTSQPNHGSTFQITLPDPR